MSGETFNDASMLEIFRAEVETHVESMTSGLLALERDPKDTSHVDEMMRGAHSIKGAARIVGIDPAVRVAHAMEDGFVAAQNGKITLRPIHVDVLLRGVDFLNRIAEASKEPAIIWEQFHTQAVSLVAEITSVLAGDIKAPIPSALKSPLPKSSVQSPDLSTAASVPSESHIALPAMFDAAAAEKARLEFIAALDAKVSLIRFDLALTIDMDATGLAFLAAVPIQTREVPCRIELVGCSNDLNLLLTATGIDRLFSSGGR